MEIKNIPISKLHTNKGQLDGLPKNPRFIDDEKYQNLKQSIQEFPEMLNLRECIVYPIENGYIIIGGNMRFKACKELQLKEIPCKILDASTPVETLREITIKDNGGYGSNDEKLLNSEWKEFIQPSWGLDLIKKKSRLSKVFENDEVFEDSLIEYPITIITTKQEFDEWTKLKEKHKIKDNTKLFFSLVSKSIKK